MQYIFLAVLAVLIFSLVNKSDQKKREQRRLDPGVTPGHFTIDQKSGPMAFFSWAFLALCVAVVAGLVYTKESPVFIALSVLLLGAPVYMLLNYYNWRIEVDGNLIRLRNAFGKTSEFELSEITSVKAEERKGGLNPYRYIFYSGNDRLFTLDENTDGIYLLERLEALGIEPEV